MAIIDPNTGKPVPPTAPAMPEGMTKEILLDLHHRIGQVFPVFGYNFKVTIVGPEGMAAAFLGTTGKKKKKKKKGGSK